MPDELTFTLDADGSTRIDSASLERSAQVQLQRRAASVLMMIQRREALDEISRISQETGQYP